MRNFVTNEQDQPLELHLAGRVVVVAPRGEVEVSAADLEAAQLKVLRRARQLGVRQVVEAAPAAAPARTGSPSRKSNKDEPSREG